MSRGLALQQTLRVWTMRHADRAFEWLTATSATERLMTETTSISPEEEGLAAAAYTPDELDHAISGYVLGLAKNSNEKVLESLKSIVNPSLKQRVGQEAAFVESE